MSERSTGELGSTAEPQTVNNAAGRLAQRGVAGLTGLTAIALALSALAAMEPPESPATPAAGVVPVPAVALPAAIDNASFYEKQSRCDSVARPGATRLGELLRATYGPASIYITRSCTSNVSEHFDGRAVDWMRSVRNPTEAEQVQSMLNFLLAPGADGTPQEMLRRLGIMYIIWNNKMIRSYDPGRGWTEYQNCSSRPATSLDTACHRNHVHFSLSWDGAAANTSWWTGQPLTMPYCSNGSSAATPGAGTPQIVTDLSAVTGLTRVESTLTWDTATGVGLPAACRLLAGRARPIDLLATGALGKRARVAALEVSVNTNAPTSVALWSSGRSQPAGQITAGIGTPATAVILVPLSSLGTVGIATSQGAANVSVKLVGYLDTDLSGPAAPADFAPPASRISDDSARSAVGSVAATASPTPTPADIASPTPNATAETTPTPEASVAQAGVKPGAPRTIRVSSAKKVVTTRWSAPAMSGSHPITSYRVAALRDPSQPSKVAGSCTAGPQARSCQIKGLQKGAKYWMSVRVSTAAGSTWAAKKQVRVK
ncbi:MAG: fibronectin type III domain-containing protein [Candidatus Nanopelagicales bacterium]